MKNILVYPAISGKAGAYAAGYLEQHGVSVIGHPSPEITHLLLDVPSREIPGGLLERLPEEVCVVGGNLALADHQTLDLLKNEWYLAKNAAITAECALLIAMEKSETVIAGTAVLVIGWGRIGKCLARLLKAMGAEVTVAARKRSDRAMAEALGYRSALPGVPPGKCRMVFNTVPAPVMEALPGCLNIDLASIPGILGSDVVWARGLPGKYAPESSGCLIGKAFLREVTS